MIIQTQNIYMEL